MGRLVVSANRGRPLRWGVGTKPSPEAKRRARRRYGTPVSGEKRALVFKRDGHRCVFCGSPEDLTVDHDVPKAKGGTNGLDNLQTLCEPCNVRKGDRLV
jgi:5-methylcytosine-specific restriction endonuclease McrA